MSCTCKAGVLIEGSRIKPCPICRLGDDEVDAAGIVIAMLDLLDREYARRPMGETLADTIARVDTTLEANASPDSARDRD